MATQDFDKLNQVNKRSMPFEDYFGEMHLSDKEFERRMNIAEDWDSVLMYILALFDIEDEQKLKMSNFVKNQMFSELLDKAEKYTDTDKYIQDFLMKASNDFVDATTRHLDDPYYTSEDRVTFNAEDNANTLGNYLQYLDSVSEYRYKTWITMADEKVRTDHFLVDHQTIPVDELFIVGASQMRFPKDLLYNPSPEEYVNCRCVIAYTK